MKASELIDLALKTGFTFAAPIDPATLVPMKEVRDMCAVNKCKSYDKNWACPPACGTIEECAEKIHSFNSGVIVQTTAELEDELDFEGMGEAARKHGENYIRMLESIREMTDEPLLALGAGGCKKCKECTYPDAPCRFPERLVHPMEGFGIMISDACKKNNITYYYGRGTLTYVGCFLFNEEK